MNEPLRIVKDWLAHATYGVNARIATIPLDGADARPADVASITDETRDGPTALGQLPTTRPCLAVSYAEQPSEVIDDNTIGQQDFACTILIRYGDTDVATEGGTRDALYVLRAAMLSLKDLHGGAIAAANAAILRNNVYLYRRTAMRVVRFAQPADDTTITTGLLVSYQGRECQT